MSAVLDRELGGPAPRVLRTDMVRSRAAQDSVRQASPEVGVDQQRFDHTVDQAKMMKPYVATIDPKDEAPLLLVGLALVAALGTLAISLFWPYLISFVTARG